MPSCTRATDSLTTRLLMGTEVEAGQGTMTVIASCTATGAHIFVTTKVWGTYHDRVTAVLDISLANLELDYVDLLLIH
ncbi:uncharacterized protein V1518DRAFT_422858 [Limtongia smithiae]|uniref:uncharacterized protein n=1 Tax=Limtongia smithiae TaxID=1125753 RepID=UPI0034CD5CBA